MSGRLEGDVGHIQSDKEIQEVQASSSYITSPTVGGLYCGDREMMGRVQLSNQPASKRRSSRARRCTSVARRRSQKTWSRSQKMHFHVKKTQFHTQKTQSRIQKPQCSAMRSDKLGPNTHQFRARRRMEPTFGPGRLTS